MSSIRHILLAIAGAVLWAASAAAHDLHASVSEISVNPRSGQMEVIHRLFADDLMLALGYETLDETSFYSDPERIADIGTYIARTFRFADPTGLLYEPDYVGAELDGEFAWVYFEGPPPEDQSGFIVDNDILAETFNDQTNMTNFRFNEDVRTAMHGPGYRRPVRVTFD